MKKLPLSSVLLLLISSIGMILIKRSGRDLNVLPPKDSTTSAFVPTPRSSLADNFTRRTRTRRPTLEDSLPPGSRVIDSKKILSGIEVILADGSHISAAGASVTSNGISFEGPFRFKLANRLMWTGADGSTLLLGRDGSSYKTFGPPGGGASTALYCPGKMIGPSGPGGTYTPGKIVEAEQDWMRRQ
jgi:hypothetical protein